MKYADIGHFLGVWRIKTPFWDVMIKFDPKLCSLSFEPAHFLLTVTPATGCKVVMKAAEHQPKYLSCDGRDVHTPVVLPPVQAALRSHMRQININARQQASVRETLHIFKFVSGALAGHQSAAVALLLQRDAAVPPGAGEVDVRRDEAAVGRRVGDEHDGEAGETVGNDGQTEEKKNLLLETSPLPEEGGCILNVAHVARGRLYAQSGAGLEGMRDFGVGISKAVFFSLFFQLKKKKRKERNIPPTLN